MKQEVDFRTVPITVHPEATRRHLTDEYGRHYTRYRGSAEALIALVRHYVAEPDRVSAGQVASSLIVTLPADRDFLVRAGWARTSDLQVVLHLAGDGYEIVSINYGMWRAPRDGRETWSQPSSSRRFWWHGLCN